MRKLLIYLSMMGLLSGISACSIIDAQQGSGEPDKTSDESDSGFAKDAGPHGDDSDSGSANDGALWSYRGLRSSGFTPVAGACQGVNGGEMKARFVLLDESQSPIIGADGAPDSPVDRAASGFVEVGPDALSLAFNHSALMDVISSPCADTFSCNNSPFAFECDGAPNLGSAPGGANLDACLVAEDALVVAPGGVEFVSDIQNDQVFGLLMENSGGLRGWNLPGTEGAWDANGDGVVGGIDDLDPTSILINTDIASDPTQRRAQGAHAAYATWVRAYQLARETERQTYFGLWSFNARELKPLSHIERIGTNDTVWASEPAPISRALSDYSGESVNEPSRANVYEAALALLQDAYSDEAMDALGVASPATVDKVLVIFVDGYDDMRENDAADIEQVISEARQTNVRIFIVHADPAFKKPSQIREDPDYWKRQTPCQIDSQCNNYETCRHPKGYSLPGSGNEVDMPEGFDQTYCLPVRDENGRVGPIADYARLACETEGGYLYAPAIETVSHHMEWTPLALDGLWEASAHASMLDPTPSPGGAALKIHTQMRATLAGQSQDFAFTQLGALGDVNTGAPVEAYDTRAVIFTAD